MTELRPLVVRAVDAAIRGVFPTKYFGLCHVYAIVGASLASTVMGCEYRPVAGLAVIDAGAGCHLKLIDNDAFSGNQGGAYHCWIESNPAPGLPKELVDLTFQHNAKYAGKHKLIWRKKSSSFLWGDYDDLVISANLEDLPRTFPDNRVWLRETQEGAAWIERQVAENIDEYVKLTSLALKILQNSLVKRLSAAPSYSPPDAGQNLSEPPSRLRYA